MSKENEGAEKIQNLPASMIRNGEIIQSNPPLQNFAEEISDSLNLIDGSAKHIFDTMRNIKPSKLDDGTIADQLDYNDIDSICKCAKEIQNLARVKLEMLRLKK